MFSAWLLILVPLIFCAGIVVVRIISRPLPADWKGVGYREAGEVIWFVGTDSADRRVGVNRIGYAEDGTNLRIVAALEAALSQARFDAGLGGGNNGESVLAERGRVSSRKPGDNVPEASLSSGESSGESVKETSIAVGGSPALENRVVVVGHQHHVALNVEHDLHDVGSLKVNSLVQVGGTHRAISAFFGALASIISRTPGLRDSCGKLGSVSGVRTASPMEGLDCGRRSLGGAARFFFPFLRAQKFATCGWRAVSCPATAIAALVFLSASAANAGHQHLESWYADALAACLPGGRTEVRMRNGTRCDVLSGTHAIEVDFGAKWGEGIGQSLNYSVQTGRAPAVAAIVETARDERGLAILRETIAGAKVSIAVIVLRPFGRSGLTLEFPAGIVGRRSIDFRRNVEAVDFIKPQNQPK